MKKSIIILLCSLAILTTACKYSKEDSKQKTNSNYNSSSIQLSSQHSEEKDVENKYQDGAMPLSPELQDLYKKAKEAYGWFDVGTMNSDGEPKILGDNSFFKVNDERFPTYQSWHDYLMTIFDKKFIDDKLFAKNYYKNIDEKLYGIHADRGTHIFYTHSEFKIKRQTDIKIEMIVIGYYDEDGKKHSEEQTIVFVKENGKWRISQFSLLY